MQCTKEMENLLRAGKNLNHKWEVVKRLQKNLGKNINKLAISLGSVIRFDILKLQFDCCTSFPV